MKDLDLTSIANQFLKNKGLRCVKVKKISQGLINLTFLVTDHKNNQHLLQSINNEVFKSPEIIQSNLILISKHLMSTSYSGKLIHAYTTEDNDNLYKSNNKIWRMLNFIEHDRCYNRVENTSIAYEAGKLLGEFHVCLQHIDRPAIKEPIEDFLNIKSRLVSYEKSLINGNQGRISSSTKLIEQLRKKMIFIEKYLALEKNTPIRIIHGDPKINNFLFSFSSEKALAIIDWDTIISGNILYDIGDMMRSFCNQLKEDDSPEPGMFNHEIYKQTLNGYLSFARSMLNSKEINSISTAVVAITLVQLMRFLTDYFNNDIYYTINYTEQNKNRALNQLALMNEMIDFFNLK